MKHQANGIKIWENNERAKTRADDPLIFRCSKPIYVMYHFIREMVRSGNIKVDRVPSEWKYEDFLTMALPAMQFQRRCAAVMNLPDDT